MIELSHTDKQGKAKMVDVSHKPRQKRRALAEGEIKVSKDTILLIQDNKMKKGDVLTLAEIAGVQAAKKTSDLIPLCHPLQLASVNIDTLVRKDRIHLRCEVICTGQTGVEMEALTGVSVGLLTIYDMCKAVDKNMEIGEIKLVEKIKENI